MGRGNIVEVLIFFLNQLLILKHHFQQESHKKSGKKIR